MLYTISYLTELMWLCVNLHLSKKKIKKLKVDGHYRISTVDITL